MSIFNPEKHTQRDVKIVAALERISHAFKVMQLSMGKEHSLSPIQMQILMFIHFHHEQLCTVSYLAQEFDITKATISDAVRVLIKKGLVEKTVDDKDSRSYSIKPTLTGKNEIKEMKDFGLPVLQALENISDSEKNDFLHSLLQVIRYLNKSGVITIQRSCYNCKFYEKLQTGHHCNLLKSDLANTEIRIDCPEFIDAGK
ncbi:winged helix-turn-helix transcriptional regulator [Fulvivirga sp. 29W222]|uniref:Winged helix-turn-helix transcriptional regulator n=1 Tax=Fulvivirga marina TaxID=2494733 RepID=A0A937FUH9_9BACT|nr:MarR family winged helix-turn-helix transcriptional regulator [Fulvivirga marina]MBL6445162.1 winged helix-turn-helix transcriptional regulator [Fulvivirga marina]